MSPTVLREKGYVFLFLSRGIADIGHVNCGDGEAKFWFEPHIELAKNVRLHAVKSRRSSKLSRHYDELKRAWKEHLSG
jgi:hypothetical protein